MSNIEGEAWSEAGQNYSPRRIEFLPVAESKDDARGEQSLQGVPGDWKLFAVTE